MDQPAPPPARGSADVAAAVPAETRPGDRDDLPSRVARAVTPWLLALAMLPGVAVASRHPPFVVQPGPRLPTVNVWALVIALLLAFTAGTARRRRWPLYLTALIGWLTLSVWVGGVVAAYYAATTGYGPPYRRTGRAARRRRPGGTAQPREGGRSGRRLGFLAVFAVAAWAAVAVPLYVNRAETYHRYSVHAAIPSLTAAAAMIGLPLAIGMWVGARRQVFQALRDRAERLEREQTARAEQARAQERARIAHEMHDVVAHRVALMVLHAGALEVNTADPATAEAAALIRTTGREALAELRQVLGILRGADGRLAPQPTLADLDALVAGTRAAGIPVDRGDAGTPRRFPAVVERAAYRTVQEGLTNVAKHAGAAATTVALCYLPEALEVTVSNAAAPDPVPAMPGAGLGLTGLRERVGVLGGRVDAGPVPGGGFALRVRIPVGSAPGPAVTTVAPR